LSTVKFPGLAEEGITKFHHSLFIIPDMRVLVLAINL